jgi:hypothetical protein
MARSQRTDGFTDAVMGVVANWRGLGLETLATALAVMGADTSATITADNVVVAPAVAGGIDVQGALAGLDAAKSPITHTHSASAITAAPSGGLSATDVQASLTELDAEKAALVHTHAQGDVTGLVTALAGKSPVGHTHAASVITYTPAGGITATDVQGAVNYLDANKSVVGHTHAASAITVVPAGNIGSTNVGAALNELDAEKAALVHTHSQSDVTGLGTALAGKSDVGHTHAASAITVVPAGNLASTDVGAALNELDAEKAALVHTHAQGDVTGLVAALAAKQDASAFGTTLVVPTDAHLGLGLSEVQARVGVPIQNFYDPADGTDWRPAIQRIRAAMASPVVWNKRVLIPWTPAGYRLSTGITVDGDDGIHWIGVGPKPRIYTTDGSAVFTRGATITQQATGYLVSGLYRAGATAVKLATAAERSNFTVGATVQLQTGDITPAVQPAFHTGGAVTPLAEFHTISLIDADGTIHFAEPLVHDFYDWGDGCRFELKVIDSLICKNITFENLHIVAITGAPIDLAGWKLTVRDVHMEGGCGFILRGKYIIAHDILINITSGWTWNGYRRPYAFGSDTGTTEVDYRNITVIATGACFVHIHEGVSNAVLRNINLFCGATDYRATGTVGAGATTTDIPLGASAPSYDITGCWLAFVDGTGKNQGRTISAYNTTTGHATVLAYTVVPDTTTVWEVIGERWAAVSIGGINRNVSFEACVVNAPVGFYARHIRISAGGMANTWQFGARHVDMDIICRGKSMDHPIDVGNNPVPVLTKRLDLSGYQGTRGLQIGGSAYPVGGVDLTDRLVARDASFFLMNADFALTGATRTRIDGEDVIICDQTSSSACLWQKDLAKLVMVADQVILEAEIEAVEAGSVFDKQARMDFFCAQGATGANIPSWGTSQSWFPFIPRANGVNGGVFWIASTPFTLDKTNTNGVATNGRVGLRVDRVLTGGDTYKDIGGHLRIRRVVAHFLTLRA